MDLGEKKENAVPNAAEDPAFSSVPKPVQIDNTVEELVYDAASMYEILDTRQRTEFFLSGLRIICAEFDRCVHTSSGRDRVCARSGERKPDAELLRQ